MIVQFYCSSVEEEPVLETINVPIPEIQAFINLVERHGYEDVDGRRYTYDESMVEYPKTVTIYLCDPEE